MNRAQKVDEESEVICLIIMFPTKGVIIKFQKKAQFMDFFQYFLVCKTLIFMPKEEPARLLT